MQSDIPYIILRPGTLGGTLSKLLNLYKKGFTADLRGGASFADIDAVAKAYLMAVPVLIDFRGQEIFNLGGDNVSIQQVFDLFKQKEFYHTQFLDKKLLKGLSFLNDFLLEPFLKKSILTRESFITGQKFTFLDSGKAKSTLNYKVKGIGEIIEELM